MHRAGLYLIASALTVSSGQVLAADMPAGLPLLAAAAVDGVNGKIEAFAGASGYRIAGVRGDNASAAGLAGSLSIPVGQSFGLQVDALASSRDGDFAGGAAAHFFMRDPSRGLFGAYGSYLTREGDPVSRARLGLEIEFYASRVTLGGVAGYERTIASADLLALPNFAFLRDLGSKNRFFDAVDVSYYATDNFRLSLGHRYWAGVHAAAFGAEYMVQTGQGAAYAFFAEGRVGQERYTAGLAGVRVYFGQKDKTLIRRHREDDPPNYLREDAFAPRGSNVYYLPGPPPPPPCCDGT